MKNNEVARVLFEAFASGDDAAARNLCAHDLQASQNNGAPMNIDTLLQFSAAFKRIAQNFRYEQVVCSTTDTGFVEEHSVRATLPDGSELDLAVCIVAEISAGKITKLREYFDSAAVAAVAAALS